MTERLSTYCRHISFLVLISVTPLTYIVWERILYFKVEKAIFLNWSAHEENVNSSEHHFCKVKLLHQCNKPWEQEESHFRQRSRNELTIKIWGLLFLGEFICGLYKWNSIPFPTRLVSVRISGTKKVIILLCVCVCVCVLSCIQLFASLWTVTQ